MTLIRFIWYSHQFHDISSCNDRAKSWVDPMHVHCPSIGWNCAFQWSSLSATKTRPRRPIGATVWIIEQMCYRPTDQPTDQPTDTASYRGALSHLKTRPSRPIRCAVWIVERMRYRPTDQPTDQPTDTASYRGALSHLKRSRNSLHMLAYRRKKIKYSRKNDLACERIVNMFDWSHISHIIERGTIW